MSPVDSSSTSSVPLVPPEPLLSAADPRLIETRDAPPLCREPDAWPDEPSEPSEPRELGRSSSSTSFARSAARPDGPRTARCGPVEPEPPEPPEPSEPADDGRELPFELGRERSELKREPERSRLVGRSSEPSEPSFDVGRDASSSEPGMERLLPREPSRPLDDVCRLLLSPSLPVLLPALLLPLLSSEPSEPRDDGRDVAAEPGREEREPRDNAADAADAGRDGLAACIAADLR